MQSSKKAPAELHCPQCACVITLDALAQVDCADEVIDWYGTNPPRIARAVAAYSAMMRGRMTMPRQWKLINELCALAESTNHNLESLADALGRVVDAKAGDAPAKFTNHNYLKKVLADTPKRASVGVAIEINGKAEALQGMRRIGRGE